MIRHMAILATQMSAALAALFIVEAFAWLNEGYGIHPVASGFIACLFIIAPHLIPKEHIND